MKQVHQQQEQKRIELTGNPFIDTCLAAIAALGNCKNIEDLTVRKMKDLHGDGTKLSRTQMRLRSTATIFPDSLITNPSVKKDKGKKYAMLTTAILNNIGKEHIQERCEMCGNSSSIDFDRLCRDAFKDKSEEKRHMGREWFPLIGSMGSDAQALPGASRSLNICATCLFAVQYLPQSVILVKYMYIYF